jgi:hypothetical protein
MRLSLRLDEDVHAVAMALARSEHISLGKAINELARRGFQRQSDGTKVRRTAKSDFPVSAGRRLITAEDVFRADANAEHPPEP